MRVLKACLIMALVVVLFGLWGCDDKPTKPEPVEPKDYYAYFVSQVSEFQYYRYHTGTGLIDSFPAPYSTLHSAFAISPYGKTMFIRPKDMGKLIEFSLDSHVVIAEHLIIIKEHTSAGRHQWIVISPDGRFLAINNNYLQIYDLFDYSRIFCDTINATGFGNFYNGGDDYVCGSWDTNS